MLLDGYDREAIVFSGVSRQRVRSGVRGGIRWCLTDQGERGSVLQTQWYAAIV